MAENLYSFHVNRLMYQPSGSRMLSAIITSRGNIDMYVEKCFVDIKNYTIGELLTAAKHWLLESLISKYWTLNACMEEYKFYSMENARINIIETALNMPVAVNFKRPDGKIILVMNSNQDANLNSIETCMLTQVLNGKMEKEWDDVSNHLKNRIVKNAQFMDKILDRTIQAVGWETSEEEKNRILEYLRKEGEIDLSRDEDDE